MQTVIRMHHDPRCQSGNELRLHASCVWMKGSTARYRWNSSVTQRDSNQESPLLTVNDCGDPKADCTKAQRGEKMFE